MTVPYTKQPIPVAQQLMHLESRGLVIRDQASALKELSRIGYYRLKAYIHPFRIQYDQGTLKPGTTIEDAIGCYQFDRDLKLAVFQALERIEIGIRALLIEHMTSNFGAFAHMDVAAFPPRPKKRKKRRQKAKRTLVFVHHEWLLKVRDSADKSNENFVSHFNGKYDGFPTIPCWMALQVTTFGSLAKVYYGCHPDIRNGVAKAVGVNDAVLGPWLHTLSYIRNICAHHHRLWNRELAVTPELPDEKHEPLWTNPPIRNRIFLVLLMIRKLLRGLQDDEAWVQMMERGFDEPFSNSWMANQMGFPFGQDTNGRLVLQKWKEHPLWV